MSYIKFIYKYPTCHKLAVFLIKSFSYCVIMRPFWYHRWCTRKKNRWCFRSIKT